MPISETGEENMGVSALYTKGYRMGRRDTEARLAARIEALEAALREIAAYGDFPCKTIARAALIPEQDK